MRRNLNRGYQKLIVWNDAIEYYVLTCEAYKGFAFELKKVASQQISEEHFEKLDALAYKIENGLLRLVAALEQKRDRGDWVDHLVVKESNAAYGEADPNTPSLHFSSSFSHHSNTDRLAHRN